MLRPYGVHNSPLFVLLVAGCGKSAKLGGVQVLTPFFLGARCLGLRLVLGHWILSG